MKTWCWALVLMVSCTLFAGCAHCPVCQKLGLVPSSDKASEKGTDTSSTQVQKAEDTKASESK